MAYPRWRGARPNSVFLDFIDFPRISAYRSRTPVPRKSGAYAAAENDHLFAYALRQPPVGSPAWKRVRLIITRFSTSETSVHRSGVGLGFKVPLKLSCKNVKRIPLSARYNRPENENKIRNKTIRNKVLGWWSPSYIRTLLLRTAQYRLIQNIDSEYTIIILFF